MIKAAKHAWDQAEQKDKARDYGKPYLLWSPHDRARVLTKVLEGNTYYRRSKDRIIAVKVRKVSNALNVLFNYEGGTPDHTSFFDFVDRYSPSILDMDLQERHEKKDLLKYCRERKEYFSKRVEQLEAELLR